MKFFKTVLLISFLAFVFINCSDNIPNTGTFSINFGTSSARSFVESEDSSGLPSVFSSLLFTVKVTDGPGSNVVRENLSPAGEVQKFSVTPGTWTITIEAYLEGKLYAVGSAKENIIAGDNGTIAIKMEIVGFEIVILMDDLAKGALNQDAPVKIYKDENNPSAGVYDSVLVTIESGYEFDSYEWKVGNMAIGNEEFVQLEAANYNAGTYQLTLTVTKDGIPYSVSLYFEVVDEWTRIYTVEQLNDIRNNLSGKFLLERDLVITFFGSYGSAGTWELIGNDTNQFNGLFNGNGKTINMMLVDGISGLPGGLFGVIGESGIVQNLNITGVISNEIDGQDLFGGAVASINYGTISNVSSSASVTMTGDQDVFAGGIAGQNWGTINNCLVTGNVSAQTDGNVWIGSIAGDNGGDGLIRNCAALNNKLTVTDSDYILVNPLYIGRIVGASGNDRLYNNYARADMIGNRKAIEGELNNGIPINFKESKYSQIFNGWDTDIWNIPNIEIDYYSTLPSLKGSQAVKVSAPAADWGWYLEPIDSDVDYIISTAQELLALAEIVNHWSSDRNDFDGMEIKLINSIDLSVYGKDYNDGGGWIPIGSYGSNDYIFKGTFDGNDCTISGLFINKSILPWSNIPMGLFGRIEDGTVIDLKLIDVYIAGQDQVGGIAGYNAGTIENCSVIGGSVKGNDNVGGIAGYNEAGSIENCYNTGGVTGNNNVGGIVGYNEAGSIENCYNTGGVTGNSSNVGGIAGNNGQGDICFTYNTGNVNGSNYVGGIVGSTSKGSVTNNVALCSSVTATQENVGRIVGDMNEDTLSDNYARNDINEYVGWDNNDAGIDGESISSWDDSQWWEELGFDDPWWTDKLPLE